MKRSLPAVSLSVAAVITLSACGSSSGGDMEGMDTGQQSSAAAAPTATTEFSAEPSTEASAGASDEAMAGHSDVDVMFAQMMIPHHRQAVEMSEMILAKDGIDPQVTELAATIKDAQGPEIETMTGWLEAWGEPMAPQGGVEGHDMGDMGGSGDMEGMSGMMSEDQMAEFESAEGVDASRMFLESMTAHHKGAIDMAQDEITNGQNPEVVELAETIVETQQAEIDEMQQLLATL